MYIVQMKHLLYKTTHLPSGEYYIGIHSCTGKTCTKYSGGACQYKGSGVRILKKLKKYPPEEFQKIILSEHPTREALMAAEKRAINLSDPKSLNLVEGGQAHKNPSTREGLQVEYEGVVYPSIKAVAEAFNTSPEHASKWVRGLTVRRGSQASAFKLRGKVYHSLAEAEEDLGHKPRTLKKMLADPNYTPRQNPTPQPIEVDGVKYKSIREASFKTGRSHLTLAKMLKGHVPYKVRGAVSVEGKIYTTPTEASKALDTSYANVTYRCKSKSRKFKNWFFVS